MSHDSSSDLSSARSDISDVSDWTFEELHPKRVVEGASPLILVKERPVGAVQIEKLLPGYKSSTSTGGCRKRCKLNQPRSASWGLYSRLKRIPAPFSARPNEEGFIRVHLTFERDVNGKLFYPTDIPLGDSERFIISHSTSASKIRNQRSGRLDRSDNITGFSASLPDLTEESAFEVHVQQLLRSYFLHPAPEHLSFEFEFRLVRGDEEGNPQVFDRTHRSLLDFCRNCDAKWRSLAAVVTRIISVPKSDPPRLSMPLYNEWTHWVRVNNENKFVDRFPGVVPEDRRLNCFNGHQRICSKDRAILFGVGLH